MSRKKKHHAREGRRSGFTSGALGTTYAVGGYCLSTAQFGYTTAQAADGSSGTTDASSAGTDGDGDGSGGTT